ncbi:MAG: hypothetical protein IPH94_06870 [Saprospiraceae bacterium]|nr:hypothetical protein [Saprospiraceae bacterium]
MTRFWWLVLMFTNDGLAVKELEASGFYIEVLRGDTLLFWNKEVPALSQMGTLYRSFRFKSKCLPVLFSFRQCSRCKEFQMGHSFVLRLVHGLIYFDHSLLALGTKFIILE